jgi:malate dehydrogenase (oxaloacetate-decarboxylating)(NADP+)
MEGKALLFKRFAGIDAIDIEVKHETSRSSSTPWRHRRHLRWHQPGRHQGPRVLRDRAGADRALRHPVFHDDQHGTAIVTAAGLLNALEVQGKRIEQSRIVCMGAGAAATACMDLLIKCGCRAGEHLHAGPQGGDPQRS